MHLVVWQSSFILLIKSVMLKDSYCYFKLDACTVYICSVYFCSSVKSMLFFHCIHCICIVMARNIVCFMLSNARYNAIDRK